MNKYSGVCFYSHNNVKLTKYNYSKLLLVLLYFKFVVADHLDI